MVITRRIKTAVKTLLGWKPGVYLDREFLMHYMAKSLSPNSVYVEVGAFTGRTGLWFRDLAHLQAGNCYLIEACPTNFEIMKEICPGFHLFNLAISDTNGVLPFYVVNTDRDEGTSRSNSFDREHLEERFGKENVQEINVRSVNLNTFFDENKIGTVDFLFFNCEGAEYKILNGKLDFLDRVNFFYLDLHHRKNNVNDLKKEQHAIYEKILNKGFIRIGGHLRETSIRVTIILRFYGRKPRPRKISLSKMNFNSLQFFVFLIFSIVIYRFTPKQYRKVFFTITGFYFYSFWSIKFTSLLVLTSVVDYFLAIQIERAADKVVKKRLLIASVILNLGILGFFKYFNFFVDNAYFFFNEIGLKIPHMGLQVILPVGISFYTFQELSYTIDVYRGQCRARTNYFDVAGFVAFFPQLVAGPIERASHLMDQLENPAKPKLDDWVVGIQLMLWGLFQKMVIADNVAHVANFAFDSTTGVKDMGLALAGVYAFAIQIYCDFAGYTDIARGSAKLFGIDIMKNFNMPYLATSIRDFWARWHISLSTWLRDYLYIPLGGNRASKPRVAFNLMLTMFLGGLWHGATWMFVLWGLYHGVLLTLEHFFYPWAKDRQVRWSFGSLLKVFVTFNLVCFGWVLFRSTNIAIFQHWCAMFFSFQWSLVFAPLWGTLLIYSTPLWLVWGLQTRFGLSDQVVPGIPSWAKVPFWAFVMVSLIYLASDIGREFIYFQF